MADKRTDSGETAAPDGRLVTLRPITYEDTERIVRWRNDPAVRVHFVYREPFTTASHERWMREEVETGRVVQFIICDRTERPVGSVYLRDIDRAEKSAEYGIFIGEPDVRGRGYASEAARLVVAYGFQTLGLSRIGLRVYQDNDAAIASYEAAGFRVVRELTGVTASDGTGADMYWMEVYA